MSQEDVKIGGPEITDVELRFVQNGFDGLAGWASCVIDRSIKLNRIAIRRGRDGGLYLTFPARLAANGEKFSLYHPISSHANATLTDAILGHVETLLGPGRVKARDEEAG